jgi:long-chain acyl-CoA synthetase
MGLVGAVILHLVGLLLIIVDFALYCLLLGPFRTIYKFLTARRVFAKPYAQADINGEGMPPSKVWRSVEAIAQGKLTTTTDESVTTAYEALCVSYKKHATVKSQGIRPLLRWQKDEGFRFEAKVQ